MELKIAVTRKAVLKTVGVLALMGLLMFAAFTYGVSLTYQYASRKSYEAALADVQSFLTAGGYTFDWNYKGDGQYTFTLHTPTGGILETRMSLTLHMETVQRDIFGIEKSYSYHSMSLTNGGKDWIKVNLFNGAGAVNASMTANYVSVSASTDVFSASWTTLPNEVTGNGLDRANMTYVEVTTGQFNLTHTFSVTGTQSTQLYGLSYDSYANAHTVTLVAAEQQGAGAVKNLVAGDSLAITIQGTISYT